MTSTNTSSTPLILTGSTYAYTENLGGVQKVRYIHVDGPTRPNTATIITRFPYFTSIDNCPRTCHVTYK